MHTLEQLKAAGPALLLCADRALAHLPAIHLSANQARALSYGQSVPAPSAPAGQLRLYEPGGRFVGLGLGVPGGELRPLRLFNAGAAASS
jgi:tRNA pseudouridine55 synthase